MALSILSIYTLVFHKSLVCVNSQYFVQLSIETPSKLSQNTKLVKNTLLHEELNGSGNYSLEDNKRRGFIKGGEIFGKCFGENPKNVG